MREGGSHCDLYERSPDNLRRTVCVGKANFRHCTDFGVEKMEEGSHELMCVLGGLTLY